MSWCLRLSVETILRLTPAVLGSTVTQPPTPREIHRPRGRHRPHLSADAYATLSCEPECQAPEKLGPPDHRLSYSGVAAAVQADDYPTIHPLEIHRPRGRRRPHLSADAYATLSCEPECQRRRSSDRPTTA